jgi:hypothetical protein
MSRWLACGPAAPPLAGPAAPGPSEPAAGLVSAARFAAQVAATVVARFGARPV